MRAELARVLATLLAESERSRAISLDRVGDALGTMAVSAPEIEALVDALEAKGREVQGPSGGGGESRLKVVLSTARALSAELARTPNAAEIAARSGLDETQVRHALALAKVIARG